MPRQGPPHAELVRKLNERMVGLYAGRYRVSPQCPVVLLAPPPDYVEPDVALLKPQDYSERDVTSEDIELIVEISDSTLERDQGEKLAAYARNRIPEVWVLDVNANLLHTYQDSNSEIYRQNRILEKGSQAEFSGEKLEWW